MQILDQCWRDLFPDRFYAGKRAEVGPVFLRQRYRSMPAAVQEALQAWWEGRIELQLFFTVPTVEEILVQQSEGRRCVSVLIEEDEIVRFEESGRDFLSFLIHDLVHAGHFFFDATEYRRQVAFSCWMKELLKTDFAGELAERHPELLPDFHYLISDMNSHSVHLFKTLKALLERGQGLEERIQFPAFSTSELGVEFSKIWKKLNSDMENEETHRELLKLWDLRTFSPSNGPV